MIIRRFNSLKNAKNTEVKKGYWKASPSDPRSKQGKKHDWNNEKTPEKSWKIWLLKSVTHKKLRAKKDSVQRGHHLPEKNGSNFERFKKEQNLHDFVLFPRNSRHVSTVEKIP